MDACRECCVLSGRGVWVGLTSRPRNSTYTGCFTTLGITAEGDFLGLCDQKSSYKHVSDFGRLRSYGRFLIPVHALV